jgi:hypothetical protein
LRAGQFASAASLRDNSRRSKTPMLAPANLFGMLTEFVVLLLGALLFVIGVSGNYGITPRPVALIVVGIALIYWGVRSAMQRAPKTNRTLIHVRSSSLILVGLTVLTIPIFPRQAGILLALGGGALVIRGILGAVLFLRRT